MSISEYFIEHYSYWQNARSYFVGPFSNRWEAEKHIPELEKSCGCTLYPEAVSSRPQNIKADRKYLIVPASKVDRLEFSMTVSEMYNEDLDKYIDLDIRAISNKRLNEIISNAL